MNQMMYASKDPIDGLCISRTEPIHKINDIKRKLAELLCNLCPENIQNDKMATTFLNTQ